MNQRGYWYTYWLYVRRLRRARDYTVPFTRVSWPGASAIVGAHFAWEARAGNAYEVSRGDNCVVFVAQSVGLATIPSVHGMQQVATGRFQVALSLLASAVQLLFWVVLLVVGVNSIWGENWVALIGFGALLLAPSLVALFTSGLARRSRPLPPYVHIVGAASSGGRLYRQVRQAIVDDATKPLVLSETRNPSLIRDLRGLSASGYDVTEVAYLGRVFFTVQRT